MPTWDELRIDLIRLRNDDPCPLYAYPDPTIDEGRTPPFSIEFKAWAVDVAAELHDRFGDDVRLTVGFLHFPDGAYQNRDGTERQAPLREMLPRLDSNEITVSLDHAVEVRSGHSLRSALRVHNHRGQEVLIRTNGQLTAVTVDPHTDEAVGGVGGQQKLPGVLFRIAAGATTSIPLFVGTTSRVAALGYALPPGRWAIEVILNIEGEGRYRTSPLPLSIVA